MYLCNYIDLLKKYDPNQVLPIGLGNPHSWRGSYYELAFEPVQNISIGEMLETAGRCIGRTFSGWKGGDFEMHEYTTIHIDWEGTCEGMGLLLFVRLLAGDDISDIFI
jgi:hypothetical protein